MRAVNLLPASDARHGASSGSGSFILLGVLALLVVMAAAYTLTGRSVAAKRAELAQVTTQAADVEARAGDLESYARFANTRKSRLETVQGLIAGRFDWAHAMGEVARTLPSDVWVTSMRATADPSVSVDGTSDELRSALAVPAVELAGCAPDQEQVAVVMASLRGMSKVQRVSLSASQKQGGGEGSGGGDSASADGCDGRAQFSMSIFFEASEAQAAAAAAGGTTP